MYAHYGNISRSMDKASKQSDIIDQKEKLVPYFDFLFNRVGKVLIEIDRISIPKEGIDFQ